MAENPKIHKWLAIMELKNGETEVCQLVINLVNELDSHFCHIEFVLEYI